MNFYYYVFLKAGMLGFYAFYSDELGIVVDKVYNGYYSLGYN